MKIFGLTLFEPKPSAARAVEGTVEKAQSFTATSQQGGGGWFGIIREPFAGAWTRFMETDAPRDVLAFSAVYACVSLIASDIAKLGVKLMVENPTTGVSAELKTFSPYLAVLKRPNRFQTWYQFIEHWVVMKLLYGNAYVLKERIDKRGIVTALYVLNSQRVVTLVADDGGVYYQLTRDPLSGLAEPVTVPASEIIHDTAVTLWHPLVGVSPLYAAAVSATMGNRIQSNSTRFFSNASRPSGMLSAPGRISDEVAGRLKAAWEENFSGPNIGRLAVLGDGLKYEAMTISAEQAQLIKQLEWSAADVARPFHVPLWKLGLGAPPQVSVESLNQQYYSDCLQAHLESIESHLNDGLEVPDYYCVEFDLENLMRMDTAARFEAKGKAVKDGWLAPNEVRVSEGYKPVKGGDSPMMQQQNYSLAALDKRDTAAPPPPSPPVDGAQPSEPETEPTKPPPKPPAPPAPEKSAEEIEVEELTDYIAKELVWT